MLVGKIISLSKEKGFGFIKPDSGGNDVFFHHRAVEGEFDALQEGEEVQYEEDSAAEKPRAKLVKPIYAGPRAKQSSGTKKREERRSTFENAELGFVTKLRRKEKLGFISADSGGPELLFGMENVSGIRPFAQLAVGDSVRFLRSAEADEAGPPLASAVQYTERRQHKSDLGLPQNPRARKKKPTWRR